MIGGTCPEALATGPNATRFIQVCNLDEVLDYGARRLIECGRACKKV
jgi:hypothetical protein